MKKKYGLSVLFVLLLVVVVGCSSDNNNVLSNTTSVTTEKLTMEVPSSFERSTNGDAVVYSWDDFDGERKNSCSLRIYSSQSYSFTNVEEKARNNVNYMVTSPEDVNVSTTTINGNVWTVAEVSTSKSKYSSYVIVKDDILYEVLYDDIGSGDICGEAFNTIVNSLKFN